MENVLGRGGRKVGKKKRIDHLPYEVDDEKKEAILDYINMDGGNEKLKKKLMKYSPDRINEDNIQSIVYQMTHGKTHV